MTSTSVFVNPAQGLEICLSLVALIPLGTNKRICLLKTFYSLSHFLWIEYIYLVFGFGIYCGLQIEVGEFAILNIMLSNFTLF